MVDFSRRSFLKASGAATVGPGLAGCTERARNGDGGGESDGTAVGSPSTSGPDPVVIGALQPFSGLFSPYGAVHQSGLEFAVAEVNDGGGVLDGRDLDVVVTDTASDPADADASFRRMVEQDGAVATTGAVSSDVGIVLSQTAEDLQVPHLLHMAGDDKITTEDSRHIFRVGLIPASTYMHAQASAFADRFDSIGAVIADYAWGHAIERGIQAHFEQDVSIQVAPPSESNFRSYIRQFDDDLEMLITSGHPPGAISISNQTFELGLAPEVITGSNAPSQTLFDGLSDLAIEKFTHVHQSDPYSDRYAEVAHAYGEVSGDQFYTHTAYGYVTGRLLAAAIDDAGTTDPTEIADSLRSIEFETLTAAPIKYSQFGELDDAVIIYSRILPDRAPPYSPDGTHSYSEVGRSDAIPAAPPEA